VTLMRIESSLRSAFGFRVFFCAMRG
jgi:hypothetical protein